MPDTPLGNIVAIRSEKDAEVIKEFTPAQRQIYNEWQDRRKDTAAAKEEYDANLDALFAMALA